MIFLLIDAIVVPLIASPILYWLSLVYREKTGHFSFAILLVPLVAILFAGLQQVQGTYSELYAWSPIGTFGLRVDNLSLPVAATVALLSSLVALFSVP